MPFSPICGRRSMVSITRWERSRSVSTVLSKGVVIVPSSLCPFPCSRGCGSCHGGCDGGQPVDQPWIGMESEDDGLVLGE